MGDTQKVNLVEDKVRLQALCADLSSAFVGYHNLLGDPAILPCRHNRHLTIKNIKIGEGPCQKCFGAFPGNRLRDLWLTDRE
jgi:hypothetical protein